MNLEENLTQVDLEKTIKDALFRIRSEKEKDLCKFLPSREGEGYIHHFTLRKMKKNDPSKLESLLNEFIIGRQEPKLLNPKKRAPKGSRKNNKQLTCNVSELVPLLEIARAAGYHDLVAKLTPRRSLASLKKQLIESIRQGKVENELWASYVELVKIKK